MNINLILTEFFLRENVTNAVLCNDYLVSAKVCIKKNSEITTYYDWHLDKQIEGIPTASL